ncbi:MAG: VWA domain-containing protein [Alphaproteobacteria bacterium]|nr:VWA domain-containing protein [Alphaproteobacteria bacterium]
MLTLLLSLSFAAEKPAWAPTTFTLPSTINKIPITRTEIDGWIQRSAGAGTYGYGYDDGGYEPSVAGGGAKGSRRYSAVPSMAPPPPPAPPKSKPAEDYEGAIGRVAQNDSPLKAGTTDDNAAFGEFLEFLATWKDKPGIAGNHVEMDVTKHSAIQVRGADGSPLPGARVTVSQDGRHVWSGTTYGDGHAPFFPDVVGAKGGDFQVQVTHDSVGTRTEWDGAKPLVLSLDDTAKQVVDLDVVFVIDTTGSMSDEIDRIKQTLLTVTAQVQDLDRPIDLRYGAVLYRDLGDEYLTRHTPLTKDLKAFDQKLQGIQANGGGDGPESFNQGLAVAVGEMDWREDAAKLVFLVADAPPHMDYENDVDYARVSQSALSQGIRIHTVAASGLDDFGSLVFRQTAQLTQGQFIFIEYGSTAASAADHGVTGPVQSNNLDAILLRQITREVEGWGTRLVAMK